MKVSYLIFLGVTTLCSLGVGLYLLLGAVIPSAGPEFVDSFPEATGEINLATNEVESRGGILAMDGEVYPAAAFVEHPETEVLSESFYSLSGDAEAYDIFYDDVSGTIMVLLYQEPLGFTRVLAEKKLREVLPYTADELCSFQVLVTTNQYVNASYDGVSLGLSFCADSISLE